MFSRLSRGLGKTRTAFMSGLGDLLHGKTELDQATLEALETRLLQADLGIHTTMQIIDKLPGRLQRVERGDDHAIMRALQQELLAILQPLQADAALLDSDTRPRMILLVGVNGAGKTTTAGKLASLLQRQGEDVLLAAGDTFRAAAIEQLQSWGQRSNIPVIAHQAGADCAAVIFDALQSARAKQANTVLADTAGRLHTKDNLMAELKKAARTINKLSPRPQQETLLVIDATAGQNALIQARRFHEAIGLDGIILTKLDGTAKGGIVFSLAQTLHIPIKFIGIGEHTDDLRPFVAEDFVNALLSVR